MVEDLKAKVTQKVDSFVDWVRTNPILSASITANALLGYYVIMRELQIRRLVNTNKTFRNKHLAEFHVDAPITKKLSVVIPCLNEEEYLPKLLDSLEKSTFKDFEVIVADCQSEDTTIEKANSYADRLDIRTVISPERNVSIARNTGASGAQGQYIMFIDSDALVHKDFLTNVIEDFEKKGLDVGAAHLVPISDNLVDQLIHSSGNLAMNVTRLLSPMAPGAGLITTREMFNRLNGFDPTIDMGEDSNYAERASLQGKFNMIDDVVFVSVRRLEKEGRRSFLKKYFKNFMFRNVLGKDPRDGDMKYFD